MCLWEKKTWRNRGHDNAFCALKDKQTDVTLWASHDTASYIWSSLDMQSFSIPILWTAPWINNRRHHVSHSVSFQASDVTAKNNRDEMYVTNFNLSRLQLMISLNEWNLSGNDIFLCVSMFLRYATGCTRWQQKLQYYWLTPGSTCSQTPWQRHQGPSWV